jgi:hypothetical protein
MWLGTKEGVDKRFERELIPLSELTLLCAAFYKYATEQNAVLPGNRAWEVDAISEPPSFVARLEDGSQTLNDFVLCTKHFGFKFGACKRAADHAHATPSTFFAPGESLFPDFNESGLQFRA